MSDVGSKQDQLHAPDCSWFKNPCGCSCGYWELRAVKAHGGDPWAARFGQAHWRDDNTCSYCGSMTVARATELLTTKGTRFSGSDWKYGYPHKFYIGNGKFYTEHLRDATREEVAAFNKAAEHTVGIAFNLSDDGKLYYIAPSHGYQNWGNVG